MVKKENYYLGLMAGTSRDGVDIALTNIKDDAIETIDALINGLLEYQGGVMVITHDSELITRLDSKLWILRDRKIDFYKNDFDDYVDEVLEEG